MKNPILTLQLENIHHLSFLDLDIFKRFQNTLIQNTCKLFYMMKYLRLNIYNPPYKKNPPEASVLFTLPNNLTRFFSGYWWSASIIQDTLVFLSPIQQQKRKKISYHLFINETQCSQLVRVSAIHHFTNFSPTETRGPFLSLSLCRQSMKFKKQQNP